MEDDRDSSAGKEDQLGDITERVKGDNINAHEKLKEKFDILVENTVKLLADNELLHAELDKIVRDNSRLKIDKKLAGQQPITDRHKLNSIDVAVEKGGYSFIIVAAVAIICFYLGKFSNS